MSSKKIGMLFIFLDSALLPQLLNGLYGEGGDGMSVLIKGMEIPTSCDKCRFCVNGFTDSAPMYECAVQSYENVSVLVESNGQPFDFKPDWCPLIELPPHGRLIAEKTITEIKYHDADGYHIVNGEQLCELEIDAETVIEAEGSETDA